MAMKNDSLYALKATKKIIYGRIWDAKRQICDDKKNKTTVSALSIGNVNYEQRVSYVCLFIVPPFYNAIQCKINLNRSWFCLLPSTVVFLIDESRGVTNCRIHNIVVVAHSTPLTVYCYC
jgi:hypothetical protein